jgi:signal peptidase II
LKKPVILIFLILILDQASKFWVKLNMTLGQEFRVLGDWFLIHFTENPGMAFGLEFAGENGKLFLTLFRIVAATLIAVYLQYLILKKENQLLIFSISLIFAGAVGNILDSIFYGLIFSASTFFETAQLFPEGGGYTTLFHGRVVDMLYFPIITGSWPQWFPFWGGQQFIFFRPVFNIADSSITIGVFILILFQKRFFKSKETDEKDDDHPSEREIIVEPNNSPDKHLGR